jgi:hypothetical protein
VRPSTFVVVAEVRVDDANTSPVWQLQIHIRSPTNWAFGNLGNRVRTAWWLKEAAATQAIPHWSGGPHMTSLAVSTSPTARSVRAAYRLEIAVTDGGSTLVLVGDFTSPRARAALQQALVHLTYEAAEPVHIDGAHVDAIGHGSANTIWSFLSRGAPHWPVVLDAASPPLAEAFPRRGCRSRCARDGFGRAPSAAR